MIYGLDTSFVVRLLTRDPLDLATLALRYLRERQRDGDTALISNLVFAETYHALQYHYGVSKKDSLDALRHLLASPGVEASGATADVLGTPNLESAKPGFVDRVIHQEFLQANATLIVTFERAASKLPRVEVLGL